MRTELVELLTAYLMGWKTLYDCAEWSAGIDWDDRDLNRETVKIAGRLELLATEVLEGLRPEVEFWQEASNFVARETNSLYSQPVLITNNAANSSNDDTNRIPELILPAVGASQS